MKNIILIILLLWSSTASAQIKSATLTASGLTCSMCSKSIYKSLMKVPFVKDVNANVEKSSFEISFKEEGKVSFDDVKKAVQDAGFSVASLVAVVTFSSTEVYNDAVIDIAGNTLHFVNVPKQTLKGDKAIKIIDKNFLPLKEYKKYAGHEDSKTSKRIYHVTI